jgi:hypothetical protein
VLKPYPIDGNGEAALIGALADLGRDQPAIVFQCDSGARSITQGSLD